jgi:hypothetical protein
MSDNPYSPPAEEVSRRARSRRASPSEIRAIERRLANLKDGIRVFVPLGFVFEGCAPILIPRAPLLGIALWAIGKLCWLTGMSLSAMMRGRSGAWGMFGWLSCVGYIFICLLTTRCLHCHEIVRTEACDVCGAPSHLKA